MTMISKKDFTSSNYRLFMLPAFTRAFLFKSSPLGELSYNIKNPSIQNESEGAMLKHLAMLRFFIWQDSIYI